MSDILFVISACMLTASIIIFIFSYINHIKLMNRLKKMLDDAVGGVFLESHFDETTISSLESSMRHYITMSEFNKSALSAEKDKIKELISDISHQTKTPAANILLYANLLAENCGEEHKNSVNEIIHQSEKLNMLIQALVKASRLETGIISVKPSENSVRKLINEAAAAVLPEAESRQISIHIDCDDAKAFFDLKWTAEALNNILDNAVKYADKCTVINVSVTAYELFVRIDIENNGIKISADELPKIFQRFYRSPDVHDIDGIGIGLYLSREIISAQGGYIKVSSENSTVFSVWLKKA